MSYYGTQYGCSPKYLSEYISDNMPEWQIVWAFTEPEKRNVNGVMKVRYMSIPYFWHLMTSKVFVTNYRTTSEYHKRKGQVYIQTWHSSLRLKKIEGDTVDSLPPHYVEMAKVDSQKIDYLVSGCDFSTDIFKRAFWYDGKILKTGVPRCDIFFKDNKEIRTKVLQKLNLPVETKVLLYAPTFRKDEGLQYYNLDYSRLQQSLLSRFGGEWKIMVRLHPHLQNVSGQLLCKEPSVIDVTAYDDIQELLLASDALVSDYSSLIFDYAFMGKPCFLYTPDIKDYTKNDRDLYFNIGQLPFENAEDNDALYDAVLKFDNGIYKEKLERFKEYVGNYENGHSSEKLAEIINSL